MADEMTSAKQSENEVLQQRLATMEQLLQKQVQQTEKLAKSRRMSSLLLGVLVVVFAAGLFWLNTTLATATREVPQLITATESSLEQLQDTLEVVGQLDVDAMNGTLQEMETGLGNVDFEALNQSIVDLQTVVEGLSRFMSMFS